MKSIRAVIATLLAASVGAAGRADDQSEPPVAYTLEINGQPYEIAPDQSVQINGNFSNPTVTLRVAKTRTLKADGITFDYPAYFTFEADTSDPDVQTWTASGNNVTLMLFSFAEAVVPQALAESTAEALESRNTNIEPLKIKLGDEDRSGVKATMSLGNQSVIQQVVMLPPSARGSRLLVVQEVRGEGEAEAAEVGAALKLVASSLRITP